MDLIKTLFTLLTKNANSIGLPILSLLAYILYRLIVNYPIFYGKPGKTDQVRKERANSLKVRIHTIRSQSIENRYITELTKILDKVAKKWTKDEDKLLPTPEGWTGKWFGTNPFTSESYEFCLTLALIYPIIAFILSWGLGGNGAFASHELFSDQITDVNRFFMIVICFLMAHSIVNLFKSSKWTSFFYFLAITLLLIVNFISNVPNVMFAITFIIVAINSIGVFAISRSRPRSISGVGGNAAGSVTTAGASTVAFASVGSLTFFDVLPLFGAFVFAISVATVVFGTLEYIAKKAYLNAFIRAYWIGYTLFLLAYSIFTVLLIVNYGKPDRMDLLLLPIFLGVLPLLNAPVDWLSLGFTRGFLYAIKQGHHNTFKAITFGLADIVLAILFLLLIASLITTVLAGVNAIIFSTTGSFVFDLTALLQGLRHDPTNQNYWWIYFMMLSTLIPTMVHILIASMALVLILPDSLRQKILDTLEPKPELFLPQNVKQEMIAKRGTPSEDYRRFAFIYFTFAPLLALIGPTFLLWGLYELISVGHGTLGSLLLDWVEFIVKLIDTSFSVNNLII